MAALVLAAAGCEQKRLEERNMALQRQLEAALVQNAELQAEIDTMRAGGGAPRAVEEAVPPAPPLPPPEVVSPVEPAPAPAAGEMKVWTLPDPFASGSADLKPSAMASLDQLVPILKQNHPGAMIRVEGHTDADPVAKPESVRKWQDNWGLASGRALTVVRYLVKKGIESERVYAASFAEYQPVAPNASAADRAKNRRVDIYVVPH